MAKKKTIFVCQQCGSTAPKWTGKCQDCGSWNSFLEQNDESNNKTSILINTDAVLLKLKDVQNIDIERLKTGLGEFDQVLGGGIVNGAVVLVGGEPGIGKSTIMLQISSILSGIGKNVLYVSGEESPSQIKLRGVRLNIKDDFYILSINEFDIIQSVIENNKFDFIVIDSIQTIYSKELNSASGTVSQVKHITYQLVELAKSRGITVFIVGQVTKEGAIAGPKVLEHLVDTVLYFEGDYTKGIRILRSVKNRFGPTNEVGVFEMNENGLIEISPEDLFCSSEAAEGKAIASIMEGTRVFLVEIQALVTPTYFNFSKRNATGIDVNRLNMLCAILEKKAGLNISTSDVYLNVAGGIKISETASDLSICAALVSSYKNIPIPLDTVFIGEVGLTGEVRSVTNMRNRISEAVKFGIKNVFSPEEPYDDKINMVKVKNIRELINYI